MPDLAQLLTAERLLLDAVAADRGEAIDVVGRLLVSSGAVGETFVAAMHEREAAVSTYLGEGVAIPHAAVRGDDDHHTDAIAIARFPAGVTWDGETAQVAVGIAVRGGRHLEVLALLAEVVSDPERAAALRQAPDLAGLRAALTSPSQGDER